MNINNLSDEVTKSVISYMKYRDDEIEKLKQDLESLEMIAIEHDIIKCSWCVQYGIAQWECEICEKVSCKTCNQVQDGNICYRLLGTYLRFICNECYTKYCMFCGCVKSEDTQLGSSCVCKDVE